MGMFTIAHTIIRMLTRGPATLRYPAQPAQLKEKSRGHIEIDISLCIYCGLCERHCVSQAISINKEERTWTIDRMRCIICGECVESCPKDCLFMAQTYHPPIIESKTDTFYGPPPTKTTDKENNA